MTLSPVSGPSDLTGLGLAVGTAEEGGTWVGRRHHQRAEVAVNEAMIKNYCALVEDANPDYWDGDLAPPGMLMAWMMPLPWRPGTDGRKAGLFAFDVPLPGHHIINVSTDTEIFGPIRVGDTVEATDELASLSPLKKSRLGQGHFITTVTSYAAGGRDVARNTNVLFRYDTDTEAGAPAGLPASDAGLEAAMARPTIPSEADPTEYGEARLPKKGDALGPISLDVSLHRVVLNAAATWDWFPGHHNPFYARQQGQRTIYLSTLFFHGFLDRLATGWAGRGSRVVRRRIRMQKSIFAGERASASGQVVAVRSVAGGWDADIEATVEGPGGPCVPAQLTIHVPERLKERP